MSFSNINTFSIPSTLLQSLQFLKGYLIGLELFVKWSQHVVDCSKPLRNLENQDLNCLNNLPLPYLFGIYVERDP